MAISHADHSHPNTPAARARCRKELGLSTKTVTVNLTPERKLAEQAGIVKPAQMAVVPRKRGDGGVVKGTKAAAPKNVKRKNALIRHIHDLADMPKILAYGVKLAWAADLEVRVGDRFREDEARVVINADKGEIALVWKDKNLHGLTAIWVRNWDSSVQYKVDSVQYALEICAHDSDAWDEYGNLRNA